MNIFKRWDILLVALILLSLICAFYSHVIFFDELFIKRDIGRYYYPLRKLCRQQFESGNFPFWNPYLFCGLPLFATLQSCVLYPVSIINHLGDFSHMFNIFILFHIFLAGIFMYVLMKDLGLSGLASFLAAFTFAFSGYMISAINLTISLSAAAWFPLLLYFYKKVIHNRRGRLNVPYNVFAAITLLTMLLAGDPAIVYISVFVLFCMSLYFTAEDIAERRIFSLNYLKPFFIIALLFLLLSAFQTLPFLEFLKLTEREKMQWWVASGWSVPPTDLISLAIPFFNDINWYFGDYWQVQSWLDNYYMGLVPLSLCFVGAFFDKSRKTGLLILLSVFALAIALGGHTAFYPFLYRALPFFKFIRYPVRFFFLFTFCIAALSGIGLDYFRNNIKDDERLRRFGRALLTFSFLAVVTLALLISFSGSIFVKLWDMVLPMTQVNDPTKNVADLYIYVYTAFYNFKRAIALLAAFGLVFFLGTRRHGRARVFCLVFIGIALCDILTTNLKYEATTDIRSYVEPTENIKFLQKDKTLFRIAVAPQVIRFHTRLPEKSYREGVYASKDRLISNRMAEYNIYNIGGYDSMYMERHRKLLSVITDFKKPNESRILDMLNVKYVCANKLSPRKEGYRLVNKTKTAYLFENLNWLPRAYFANTAVVIKDEDKIIEKLKDKTFEPTKEVILEEDPCEIPNPKSQIPNKSSRQSGIPRSGQIPNPKSQTAEVLSYKPNEVIIKASVTSPKFLILADSYYPGWKVFVDGRQDKIYRADYILRAVYLKEPGEHIVRFVYSPFSFKLGVGITLFGLALVALGCKYRFLW